MPPAPRRCLTLPAQRGPCCRGPELADVLAEFSGCAAGGKRGEGKPLVHVAEAIGQLLNPLLWREPKNWRGCCPRAIGITLGDPGFHHVHPGKPPLTIRPLFPGPRLLQADCGPCR